MSKSFSIVLLCLLALVSCKLSKYNDPGAAVSTGVTASPAIDFLNSVGVNSAISTRGESLKKTIECIQYTGIRWIRSGYEGNIPMRDFIGLHQQTGIRFSYGLLSGGSDIPRLLEGGRQLAEAGALLALEGLNEPNNWGITYKGKKGGGNATWIPVAHIQRDLYQEVKSDPVLNQYPVWSLSENGAETDNVGLQFLEIPEGAGTLMSDGTKYADFANCHNYIRHPSNPGLYDNQTWNAADPTRFTKVDGLYGNYSVTWRGKFPGYAEEDLINLPRVTTETGAKLERDLSEEKQARLFLNLYLAQFKRGWSYTALYLLRDRTDEGGNQRYGFYKPDYSPRKSAVYLHNLTTILADNKFNAEPGKINYSIPNKPETVHDLLLQKSDGTFELVVWGEKVSGSDDVIVDLGGSYAEVRIYNPTVGSAAIDTLENISSVTLKLSDHPMVIEII